MAMPRRFITSDGVAIAWHELGSAEGAPPILLQHGFTANTQSEWIDCGIASSLARLGRRVIGIDARGHGASDKPHDPRSYGEKRMARDVGELVTHLGIERFDLVGYSMGAIVALLAATGEGRLRRLAIGGVGEAVVLFGGVDTRALDNRGLAAVLRSTDPSGFPPLLQSFRSGAAGRGNDLLALAAHADVVNAAPMPLDRIGVPTLVIAGDTDPLAARPDVLTAAIPGAKLAIVPGDHTAARLSPQFTAALLDFLDAQMSPARTRPAPTPATHADPSLPE